MNEPVNVHGWTMPIGKHSGQLITRVPVNYLLWMVNVNHKYAQYAEAELNRRGTVVPTLDVSGHAIDRASLSCRGIWKETALKDDNGKLVEGLHAWLVRMATEAKARGIPVAEKVVYKGMKFVFDDEGCWPILKTVMPA